MLTRWCLFLDVDGTLLEFADTPGAVIVPDDLQVLLAALQRSLSGALALISGRPLLTLESLFSALRLPAAGNHGLERCDAAGQLHLGREPVRDLAEVREDLQALVETHRGLFLEDKGTTMALHYRRVPELAPLVRDYTRMLALRLGAPFEVLEGAMLCEIKPSKPDKGSAIEAFMQETPFRGRVPIYVGDDLTDRTAFEAVKRHGGITLAVGERIVGDRWLEHPTAVHRWLDRFLATGDPWK